MLEEKSMLEMQARPEILDMVENIAISKGIDVEEVFVIMEVALKKVATNKYGNNYNIRVSVSRKNGAILVQKIITVVDEVENIYFEIDKNSAGKEYQIGDEIIEYLPAINFDRSSVQPFRQILLRKIKEAEKEKEYELYKDRVGDIISGYVKRVELNNIFLELQNKAEGFLPRNQLLPREHIEVGTRIRAVINNVKQDMKGPQIILTRTSKSFVEKLFAQEINEVYEGIVEIKSIARDPGSRSKVAVVSHDSSVDPVATCVGFKGSRIQGVLSELKLEKIDLIRWSPDIANFVINAFNPIEVLRVLVDEDQERVEVVVQDSDLSLAVGRRGQNINLISRLIGWNINLSGEQEDKEKRNKTNQDKQKHFIESLDVDEVIAQLLLVEGFETVEDIVSDSKLGVLNTIPGFNEEIVAELRSRGNDFLEEREVLYKKQREDLGIKDDLINFLDFSQQMILVLGENEVKTLQDFADLSVYDLLDLFPNKEISYNKAKDLIIKAREILK